jgi:hypothetical protein
MADRMTTDLISNATTRRVQRTVFPVAAHWLMSLLDNGTTSRGGRHDGNTR